MRRAGRWSPRCTRCASAPPSRARRTADLDRAAREVLDRRRRPLELPRLPRVPRGGLHVAERGDRARHPRRPACSRTATSSRSTAGRSSRAGTPTPRSPCRSARSTTSRSGCIDVTRRSLEAAIDAGRRRATGSATSAPRSRASPSGAGFTVVREYVGHGIGTAMHEEPAGPELRAARAGACSCKDGHRARHRADGERRARAETRLLDDGWTVVTADGSRSAHFEHTIAVTDHGPEVLTVPVTAAKPPCLADRAGSGILFGRLDARSARLARSSRLSAGDSEGGDALWPSPRTTRSWSKERSSSRCPTPCSVSSWRTGTRCSRTSPGRCGCTTSASSRATGCRSSSPLRPQPRPHHLPLQVDERGRR